MIMEEKSNFNIKGGVINADADFLKRVSLEVHP